jgi:hypothetical protein
LEALVHKYFGGTKMEYSGSAGARCMMADELGDLEKRIEAAFQSHEWRNQMRALLQEEEDEGGAVEQEPRALDASLFSCEKPGCTLNTKSPPPRFQKPRAVFEVELVPGYSDSPYQAMYTLRHGVRASYGWVKLSPAMLPTLVMRETVRAECEFVQGEAALDIKTNLPWMVQHTCVLDGGKRSVEVYGAWVAVKVFGEHEEGGVLCEEKDIMKTLDVYAASPHNTPGGTGAPGYILITPQEAWERLAISYH